MNTSMQEVELAENLTSKDTEGISQATFEESLRRSQELWEDIPKNPHKYRVLTGDRPTGALHIGHYFGTLASRVKIHNMGVETFIIIADYQVMTDRDVANRLPEIVYELLLDYFAVGLNPESPKVHFFCHSQIPELNQLFLPFLSLVSTAELNRNPTVKEEIQAANLTTINGMMYTYPVHQAADILFCKANIVPVGKDQLPHLELTRKIARRFNERYAKKHPVFPVPNAVLSDFPMVLGTDGQKMSKSRNNSVYLRMSADETAKLIKGAKTDSQRLITYEPERRPEVANLLRIAAMCLNTTPESVAESIGDGGAGKLKAIVTDALNATLAPIRERRAMYAKDPLFVHNVLQRGIARAREEAAKTLTEVLQATHMVYNFHK